MNFLSESPYLLAGLVSFLVAIAIVMTKNWHGAVSMDSTFGVQKFHTSPTPRIGGVAVLSGLVMSLLVLPKAARDILQPMVVAGLPAFIAGMVEDLTKRVGVLPRLLATMVSGVVAWALTGVAMRNTGVWGVDTLLAMSTPLAVAFTAFAVGGVANAVNIIDGFNGLAAGACAIMFASLGAIAWRVGDPALATVAFTLVGVCVGFGLVNWPFGKLFFGDGGAYLIGFLLGWVAVLLPMRNPRVTGITTLLVCAYPVLEVMFSYLRKSKREGHHPGMPDKVHFHMLVHRRLARPLFRNLNADLKNGLTSPFLWIYTLIPISMAIIFYDNVIAQIVGLIISAYVYYKVYTRISKFKW